MDLAALDGYILSYFEKCSHWWQRRTRQTNFTLARYCLWLVLVFLTTMALWDFFLKAELLGLVILTFFSPIFLLFFSEIRAVEESVMHTTLRNETELDWEVRITGVAGFSIVFCILLVRSETHEIIFSGTTFLAIMCYRYFLACTPLPPSVFRADNKLARIAAYA